MELDYLQGPAEVSQSRTKKGGIAVTRQKGPYPFGP